MKIVVFGGAGWLARAALQKLSERHEVRAFDRGPEAWEIRNDLHGEWTEGEIVHGDITNYSDVHAATEGMDAVLHTAVYASGKPGSYSVDDSMPFLVNLKGLWNVLESSREREIPRVVHIGSCQSVHPDGIFLTSEIRRNDGSLYAVTKRLQEEMCRQFHDAYGTRIIVLRPDYIVDTQLGIGTYREELGGEGREYRMGWVCRHDLAEACRLSLESETIDFDIFHVVGDPDAGKHSNVDRGKELLGLEYKGDYKKYM